MWYTFQSNVLQYALQHTAVWDLVFIESYYKQRKYGNYQLYWSTSFEFELSPTHYVSDTFYDSKGLMCVVLMSFLLKPHVMILRTE
jgi:hypothetical protein